MTFLMSIAGLIGVVTIAAGIAALYINVPQPVVHIDIKKPNSLLRIAGIVLIIGGVLNLAGDAYFGIRHWQKDHSDTQHQSETAAIPGG
jgi:hypothetical protein